MTENSETGARPIFIGGLDRSGKTPLRIMLSSHPKIVLTRRTYMWARFYERYGDLSRSDNFERCLEAMLQSKHIRALDPDPDRIRREFKQGEPTYARLFALFQQHFAERMGKLRWGDQMGWIERYADPIFAAYPMAKLIHMIRDPRDRYEASTPRSRHWRGKVGWDTGRWLHSVALARRHQQRYADRYKIVRYEQLMSQPEETLRDVCAFLDEDFVPAMLTMENAIQLGDTNADLADEWLESRDDGIALDTDNGKVMSRHEIAFMQTYARHDMQAWGYSLEPIQFSLRDRLLFTLIDWPANLAGLIGWHAWGSRQPVKG